ncbi:MAG: hypothetical protein ACLSDC_11245 [Ruminococcus sp.]|jgi:hypothetical protein|uniref:hypothetical protein n=1 Tax=Ruminococcus TaxID=1263 RepID=UPI0034A49B5B
MASYLEVKEVLKDILNLNTDINEICDIVMPDPYIQSEERNIVFSNADLKNAYDNMQIFDKEKLEIYSSTYREVALQLLEPSMVRRMMYLETISDSINGLEYSLGPASSEYCVFLLSELAEQVKANGIRTLGDIRIRTRMFFRHNRKISEIGNSMELLSDFLRANTLKISSTQSVPLSRFRDYAVSFEFHFMYKQGTAISEYTDIQDMYSIGNSVFRFPRKKLDSSPQRIYNKDVIDYYTMAMESRDPFTVYISFYHIIEHYFDAVFRKKLTEEIKNKITHPDFSYKDETKLYELAKYIKKHMNSDDDSGKGNEFESLKYVLIEYVDIDELKKYINNIDATAIDYYQNNLVPFTTSKKTKIAWSNAQGVYTNLATRIYETRNSLVHSKSENTANQYRPYENKKELTLEIALIKSVAELVLINSSKII